MARALLGFVALVTLAGCGGKEGMAPVSGVVKLDGVPLEGATVTLSPIDSKSKEAPSSSGRTDANGRFVLKTADGSKGAFIGKHRVSISKTNQSDPSDDSVVNVKDAIPPDWNVDSKKTFEVPAEGTDAADFDITSAKKK